MPFLQNKPQVNDGIQLYSLGLNKSVLIVGLGNIGDEYDLTRHNVGFHAVDAFVASSDEMGDWQHKKDLKCHLSNGQMGQTRVIAIKPTTMMNLSGEAVQAVSAFYKIHPQNIIVLHDELALDFGTIRLRGTGSDAGNNGIKSVSQHIGEDYGRIRIGIGPKKPAQMDTKDFVLQRFTKEQQAMLTKLTQETTALITEFVFGGELPNDTRSFLL